jgi:excisionase family DNA binding protein
MAKLEQIVLNTTESVERRWLDIRSAADYASVKPRAIRELIWRGELPFSWLGKRHIIDRRDLDALLERRKRFETTGQR